MKIDVSQSQYHEDPKAREMYTNDELRHLRILLRRLRFLEQQIRESGGLEAGEGSGGAAFAEWESAALAFALTELEFLKVRAPKQRGGRR